jgi:hypothetical protein
MNKDKTSTEPDATPPGGGELRGAGVHFEVKDGLHRSHSRALLRRAREVLDKHFESGVVLSEGDTLILSTEDLEEAGLEVVDRIFVDEGVLYGLRVVHWERREG